MQADGGRLLVYGESGLTLPISPGRPNLVGALNWAALGKGMPSHGLPVTASPAVNGVHRTAVVACAGEIVDLLHCK
jgi:hypothetical protein